VKIPSLILVHLVVVVILAHFKQEGPEIPGGSFGPFPGACRFYCALNEYPFIRFFSTHIFYCTRNCAQVMHPQAACPEGAYLEKQITNRSEIQAILKTFKNGI
jgi:hypothetical protein